MFINNKYGLFIHVIIIIITTKNLLLIITVNKLIVDKMLM